MKEMKLYRDWLVPHGKSPAAIPVSKITQAIEELILLLDPEWFKRKVNKYRIWRKENSLEDPPLFLHREPECNPLVPYLSIYEGCKCRGTSSRWSEVELQTIRELANLAGGIFQFESYWASIPGGQGKKHVRKSIQNTSRCRGMLAEILTATNYIQRGAENIIPRFMDPRPSEDKSDIIITWKGQEIEVHCKSKIPGAGYIVPFDIFDYWAGCFIRDTRRYGRSRRVMLKLSSDITLEKAKELRNRFKQWIKEGIVFEDAVIDNNVTASCKEIQIPAKGLSRKQIDRFATKPKYRAINAWAGAGDGNYHAVSVFDVVATPRRHAIRTLGNSLEAIREQTTGKRPAIASIHLFEHLDFGALVTPPYGERLRNYLVGKIADEIGKRISAIVLTCEPKREPLKEIGEGKESPALWLDNPYAAYTIPRELIRD